jgi:ankyrin repeat protein
MKLRRACKEGHVMEIKRLISAGASVHSFDEAFERTALHYAAQHGHVECCAVLVQLGASVASIDLSGHQPLHLAAENGNAAVCGWLCTKGGADVCARTPNGSIALHYAANNNHKDVASLLVDLMKETGHLHARGARRAYEALRNNYGQTPPELARERDHLRLADLLEKAVEVPEVMRDYM